MSTRSERTHPAFFPPVPLSEPEIGGREWEYVKECLDTGWVSSVGPFVIRLEEWAAGYFGAEGAVAVASGTAALHVALLLAGVEPDDEVVVPTLTFIATANAVRYAGAWPVFIDAESDHLQMDPDAFGRFLTERCVRRGDHVVNALTGRRVRAVVPVDVLGHPCDMDRIVSLAHDAGLVVVEDAAEALGSLYKGRRAGLLGDIGCLSFNGNKIVTAGGGGLILTRDAGLADRGRYLSTQAKDDALEYIHGEIGFNYRLTNIQAAVAVAQVEQLDGFVARRRRIAETYDSGLAAVPGIRTMPEAEWAASNKWLSAIAVDESVYGIDGRTLIRRLVDEGVQARPLWQPMHRSAAHGATGGDAEWVADRLYRDVVDLPSSVTLGEDVQQRIIAMIAGGAGR